MSLVENCTSLLNIDWLKDLGVKSDISDFKPQSAWSTCCVSKIVISPGASSCCASFTTAWEDGRSTPSFAIARHRSSPSGPSREKPPSPGDPSRSIPANLWFSGIVGCAEPIKPRIPFAALDIVERTHRRSLFPRSDSDLRVPLAGLGWARPKVVRGKALCGRSVPGSDGGRRPLAVARPTEARTGTWQARRLPHGVEVAHGFFAGDARTRAAADRADNRSVA
jgi:hypothetical protein